MNSPRAPKEAESFCILKKNQHCVTGLSPVWLRNQYYPYVGLSDRRTLYTWIENEGIPKAAQKPLDDINTKAYPCNPPTKVKMDAIHRCFELGKSIKYVSDEIDYSQTSIYVWRKRYLKGGTQYPPQMLNCSNCLPEWTAYRWK